MSKLSNTEFKEDAVLVSLSMNEITVDESMNLRQAGWEKDKTIDDLAMDIMKRGQLQPVLVTKAEENGNYKLVAGFRRFRAIRMANEEGGEGLPVLARVVNVDAHGAMLDNLAENIKRQNLSPIDMGVAAVKLKEAGMTVKEIAKQFGHSDSWMRQVLGLLTLPEALQKRVHLGTLDFGVARKLVGLTEEEQAPILQAVEEALAAGEGGQAAAESARGRVKGKQKGGKKSKEETKAAKKGMSAKGVLLLLEGLASEVNAEGNKPVKAEKTAAEVYELTVKLLNGKVGGQTYHKKMVEVLG